MEMRDLENKTGQSTVAQTARAGPVPSRLGLHVTQQQKYAQTKAPKLSIRGVMHPAACVNGEVSTIFL